jgi:hypothetical protein
MTRLSGSALVVAACTVGLGCAGSRPINDPDVATGTGDASPVGTGRSTGGLPQCPGEPQALGPGAAAAGKTIIWNSSDTHVLILEERTPYGWIVSQVGTTDGTAPRELVDKGMLSAYNQGDQIKVIGRQYCQAYSGCKTFSVFREAATDRLISADLSDSPITLDTFAEAVGIPLALEEACSFPPKTNCYADEVQTTYRMVVGGDTQVRLGRYSSAFITIGGRPYTVWLGDATSATGQGFVIGNCLDAASFWASGALHFAITPGANL